jgi:hypothetical protein
MRRENCQLALLAHGKSCCGNSIQEMRKALLVGSFIDLVKVNGGFFISCHRL